MKPPLKKTMLKAVIRIENPYPDDDLIRTYADFRRVRELLPYYQFNPTLFNNLLQLTLDSWRSTARISRLSLVSTLRDYLVMTSMSRLDPKDAWKTARMRTELPAEVRTNIFRLFRKSLEETDVLRISQVAHVQVACNRLAMDQVFSDVDVEWLCAHSIKYNQALNRLLRYPVASPLISSWAKANYSASQCRIRRTEWLGWILDVDQTYEIDKQTLLVDFKHNNAYDQQLVHSYWEDFHLTSKLNMALHDVFYSGKLPIKPLEGDPDIHPNKKAYLLLTPRLHPVPNIQSDELNAYIPDFAAINREFLPRIDHYQKLTMIHGIYRSRLDTETKNSMYKKYYNEETCYTLFVISKRTKNSDLLKWMIAMEYGG
jgi:hypothetical protein